MIFKKKKNPKNILRKIELKGEGPYQRWRSCHQHYAYNPPNQQPGPRRQHPLLGPSELKETTIIN